MEIISKACNYSIRSLLYLCVKEEREKGFTSIREIADELGISFFFLTKVLQKLTQSGILESARGPTGGIRLKRDPHKLSLMELIFIVDGTDYFSTCFLGLRGCGMHTPCPMHDYWTSIKQDLRVKFTNTMVADLGKEIIKEGFRISRESGKS